METRIKGRKIYFDEIKHRYTDDMDNVYTSTTTLIGKYANEFDMEKMAKICEKIGRNPSHPKYRKYKGMSANALINLWTREKETACEKGSERHDYLEGTIKEVTKFNSINKNLGRLYTIDDILIDHNFGEVKLEQFVKTGLKEKYPEIYNMILGLSKLGFRFYAEIGVYDSTYLISGMIDLLAVKGDTFIIIDWKTNKMPLMFEAGHFEKDINRNIILNSFIKEDKKMKFPLEHLEDSNGNHYALQLSMYAHLVESFGFKCLGLVIFHIMKISETQEEVVKIPMPYLKSEIKDLLADHSKTLVKNSQKNLFQ